MSKVTSIGRGSLERLSSTTNISSGSFQRAGKVILHESFNVPWQQIQRDTSFAKQQLDLEDDLVQILCQLFSSILRLGARIVPAPAKTRNNVVLEASFVPPEHSRALPQLRLALPRIKEVLYPPTHALQSANFELISRNYVSSFLAYLLVSEIVNLIIIASHEYGHLLSYRQGNHSEALAIGISHLQQGNATPYIIEHFTWLVFREEVQAWRNGARLLKQFRFRQFGQFEAIKNNSLATYIRELKFERANLKTYYRLSSFGDDFITNCRSKLFTRSR